MPFLLNQIFVDKVISLYLQKNNGETFKLHGLIKLCESIVKYAAKSRTEGITFITYIYYFHTYVRGQPLWKNK